MWTLFLQVDPVERLANRRAMKLRLSKYGKAGYHEWADRPVREIETVYRELVDLMEKERSVSGVE